MRQKFVLVWVAVFILQACSTAPKTKMDELTEPQKANLYLDVANASIKDGDPTTALMYLQKAETHEPNSPALHHSKALAYLAKGMIEEAITHAKKAVEIAPKYSIAQNTYGWLLYGKNKKDPNAEKHLKIAAQDPVNREAFKARTNLGVLYYGQKKYSDAKVQFNKATKEAPTRACVAYYYQGHLGLRERNYPVSIESYKKATQRVCGGFADAHFALGLAYLKQRDIISAKKKFLEVARLYPDTDVAKRAMSSLRKIP